MDKPKSMFNILREKKSSIPSFHDITPAESLREVLEEGVALGNEVGGDWERSWCQPHDHLLLTNGSR